MKKKALVVGGSNGIGLSLVLQLAKECLSVHILDKEAPTDTLADNIYFTKQNLLSLDLSVLESFKDIDILIITAGFGRIAPFETITPEEIENCFTVNTISTIQIIRYFYERMLSQEQDFYCAVMGSIAGLISSPLFALYGATKAALCKMIESLNIELEKSGTRNRILNVSPGAIKGTRFDGAKENNLELTKELSGLILDKMYKKDSLFIPKYEDVFKAVLERYHENAHQFGLDSYEYKLQTGRMNKQAHVSDK